MTTKPTGPDLLMQEGRRGRFSSSLQAGLTILACFTPQEPVLGIARLAERLGMSRSTTHRYASTLLALGYLEQDASRRYFLAPRAADAGMAVLDTTALRRQSGGVLAELRNRTGRTASVAILEGIQIRYLDRRHGHRKGQHDADGDRRTGSAAPAHCTASGKLLLALLEDEARNRTIAELTLERHGPKTLRSKQALRDELDSIRRAGFAVDDEESAEGVRVLAAPVTIGDHAIGAIDVTVPADAYSPAELEPLVTGAARRLAQRLDGAE